jgi:hypothetical protein
MTVLLDQTFPRTLDALVDRLFMSPPGTRVETRVFEDFSVRASAGGRLRAHGVNGRLRSAYKPLVHFFPEETDLSGEVEIAIPNHGGQQRPALGTGDLSPGRAAAGGQHCTSARAMRHSVTSSGAVTRTIRCSPRTG